MVHFFFKFGVLQFRNVPSLQGEDADNQPIHGEVGDWVRRLEKPSMRLLSEMPFLERKIPFFHFPLCISLQGSTCFMNSLLQTPFMTVDFRDSLFRWVLPVEQQLPMSVPFQLQVFVHTASAQPSWFGENHDFDPKLWVEHI